LWAWGSNFTSRLGDGTTVNRLSPYRIGTETNWVSISSYRGNVLAIKKDGSLWAWGENSYGQLGDGTRIQRSNPVQIGTETNWKSVSSGNLLTAALKNDGSIRVWGDLSYGQGTGTVPTPVQVGTDTDWVDVSAGGYHAIAVKKDGSIWTWGNNTYGQLGVGESYIWDLRFSPVKITLPNNNTVTADSRNLARTMSDTINFSIINRESNLINLERPNFVY
jgi:alpha-tubulin suppressor-like RCC1 family protein